MVHPAPGPRDPFLFPIPPSVERPALTALALLAVANPQVAERLLHDPLEAARSHPHYVVQLDDDDRVMLASIRARARSVKDFLAQLADALEAAA